MNEAECIQAEVSYRADRRNGEIVTRLFRKPVFFCQNCEMILEGCMCCGDPVPECIWVPLFAKRTQ